MNKSGSYPVKFSDVAIELYDTKRDSDSGSSGECSSQVTIEPDSDSEECFSEITIELDSDSEECFSQVTIEPTSPEPTSSKPTSSKLKPYPYQGKKDDPNFFDFSPESIAEYEASKLNQEKSANDRNCFFKKNDSDSQNETKNQNIPPINYRDFLFNNNNSHSQKEAEKKKQLP